MKKLISVMLAVMLVLSTMTFVTVSVSAEADIPEGAELLYYEDFSSESYTKGEELLGDTTAAVTLNDADGKKVWEFKGGSSANQSVQIVDGKSQGFDGDALKIENSDRNNSSFYAYFYPKAGSTISFTDPTSDYYGKQLVIEYDVKLNNYNEYPFMAYNEAGKVPFMKATTNSVLIRTGPYVSKTGDAAKRNWYAYKNWGASGKTSFKFVIDQTGETHVMRGFQNGALTSVGLYAPADGNENKGNIFKDYVGEDYIGEASGFAYGNLTKLTSRIRPKSTDGTPVTVYLDNIKVYVIDDIEYDGIGWGDNSSANFVPETGLDVNFTSAIDKTAFEKALKVTETNDVAADNVADAIKEITLSADKKSAHVTFDFSVLNQQTPYYLWLDDEFTSAQGALLFTDPNGVAASEEWKYLDTFTTCKKLEITEVNPASGTIENYVSGQDDTSITLKFSEPLSEAVDITKAFIVKDAEQNEVGHPLASLDIERTVATLQLHTLALKGGNHKIETVAGMVYNAAGISASYSYDFSVLPFTADYESEVTGYKPGTEQNIEISLSYPLSVATINDISNKFLVRNQYGSSVLGLGASVSEDGKKITLSLKNLDIDGGNYVIASKTDSIVNINGEALASIVIDLSTSATADVVIGENTGVATGSGTDLEVPYTYDVLLDEDFDNAGYVSGADWITDSSAIPEKFGIKFAGTGASMPGSSVSIVADPVNPENMVLKNVAGTDGTTVGRYNHHIVQRYLDGGTKTFDTANEDLVIKMSTKVYIKSNEIAGFPGNSDGENNSSRIIGMAGDTAFAPKTHPNIRRTSATAMQYNSWIGSSELVYGTASSSVAANLTTDEWHTIDFVFGCENGVPSYQVVIDGTAVTAAGGYYKADYSSISGMLSMLTPTASRGSCAVYYDDWKMEKINKLKTHINTAAVEVPETQQIDLTFTNDLTEEAIALILDNNLVTLKEASGTSVVADVYAVGTNRITIKPKYGLKYQTTYIAEVGNSVTNDKDVTTYAQDVFGNTFEGLYYSFETKKSLANTIDKENCVLTYDTDYLHEETDFTYKMVLSEPATCKMIGAVATFGDGNELLGIKYMDFDLNDTEKTFSVSSKLGTKYIRLYIWEKLGDGSMGRLMQIPDEVTSR